MFTQSLYPLSSITNASAEAARSTLSTLADSLADSKPQSRKEAASQARREQRKDEPVETRDLFAPFFINPFSFMRSLLRDVNQEHWAPQVEVFEKEGTIIVRADLPGLRKEDLRVEVKDGVLHIEGKRFEKQEDKRGGNVLHTERAYGAFSRTLPLPAGTDVEEASAWFDQGVLEVHLKAPPALRQSKRIDIEDAAPGESRGSKRRARPAAAARTGKRRSSRKGSRASHRVH